MNRYGSKDVFINEYRVILAERLLNIGSTYETETEEESLERFKLKFGELSMASCDVMLRDIQESRRVNRLIHSQLATAATAPINMSATIVSAPYVTMEWL